MYCVDSIVVRNRAFQEFVYTSMMLPCIYNVSVFVSFIA